MAKKVVWHLKEVLKFMIPLRHRHQFLRLTFCTLFFSPAAELLGLCVHPDSSKCFLNLTEWQYLASLQDKASS